MTDPTNTEETAGGAARRFARELARLADGLRARGVDADPMAPVDTAYVDAALAAIDRLTYERRILGRVRRLLDELAETEALPQHLRDRAAADAQAIVDEIGHPVTDEPALGQSYREQLADVQRWLARCPIPPLAR